MKPCVCVCVCYKCYLALMFFGLFATSAPDGLPGSYFFFFFFFPSDGKQML